MTSATKRLISLKKEKMTRETGSERRMWSKTSPSGHLPLANRTRQIQTEPAQTFMTSKWEETARVGKVAA